MSTAATSGTFVGRRAELAVLAGAVDATAAGAPGFVLVGGEAGVGKSRLVEQAVSAAAGQGLRVTAGHCVELGMEGLPFAPLLEAVRGLLRSVPPADRPELLGPARLPLARLLPDLGLDGGVPGSERWAGGPAGTPGQLLELVVGLLERLSRVEPLLVVVEDLHWADQSTLDLLSSLVRTVRAAPVLVLATYRSDELNRRHPLRGVLTGWERLRSVVRLDLARFDRDEVAEQLAGLLDERPAGTLVDRIYERSGGNAFLVEELAEAVRVGGDADVLPGSLREVLLARVDVVSEPARRLLRAASAGGHEVGDRLLAAVSGLGDAEFFEALREAVDAHLLVVDQGGRSYRFRHALARDAVYDDMLPGERLLVHAAYGEVLARQPELARDESTVPAALAYHWYAALDLPRALEASVAAAEQAVATFAPLEAQQHLERALAVWPRVDDAERRTGMDHVELLRKAAVQASRAGRIARSLLLFGEALEELPDTPATALRRAQITVERCRGPLRAQGRNIEAIAELEAARAALPADGAADIEPALLDTLAWVLPFGHRRTEARQVAARAVEAAAAVGDRRSEANARVTLGGLQAYLDGDAEAAMAEMRRAWALAREAGEYEVEIRAAVNLSDCLELFGEHAAAAEAAAAGRERAVEVGMMRTLGTFLIGNLAEPLMRLGRSAEAEALIDEALGPDLEGLYAAALLVLRAELRAIDGRYAEALADAALARSRIGEFDDLQWGLPLVGVEADVARAAGDLDGARDRIAAALVDPGLDWADRYLWPVVLLGLRVVRQTQVRARDRRAEPGEADRAFRRTLVALLDRLPPPVHPRSKAQEAIAAAERARIEDRPPAEQLAAWAEAVARARTIEEPALLAGALVDYAETLCVTGARAQAAAAAGEARTLAAGASATPLAEAAAGLARRAGLDLAAPSAPGPAAPPAANPAADPLAGFGLTDREREVLALVAAGRSNAQIGRALFISPKTASVHVSNLLAKLGVGGRVEAAAMAHRLGVTAPADA